MKNFMEFLKTSIAGGVLVLLPLLLLYLLLAELLELVVALATPIADLFPKGTFDKINAPVLLALILIVGVSFVFGLALRSMTLRRFGPPFDNPKALRPLDRAFDARPFAPVQCGEESVQRTGGSK
jgi:uncharacterized membrane protein